VNSSTRTTYRYAGDRYDNETGLYYVNARYYNPNLGRFLQTDPIGLSGGTNLYAYVGNDPMDMVDPTGLCANTNTATGISVQQTPMQTLNGQPLQFPNQGAPDTYPNTGNLYGYGIGVEYTAINACGNPVTTTGMTLSESVVLASATPVEAGKIGPVTAQGAIAQWPNGAFYDGITNASADPTYPSYLASLPNYTAVYTQTLTLTQAGRM
jgi:RHS repeat-associated protein